MNTSRFSLTTALLGAVALLPLGSVHSQTATATTDPVGYTTASFQANSDTVTSIPFTRPVAYTGLISSVNGNTITLAGSPGFTNNAYVYVAGTQPNTYYAIVGPLNAAVTGTITATNGSKTLTGSSTTFGTDVKPGDALTINSMVYTVVSVQSTTSLTLDKAYAGATASSLSAIYDHSPKEGNFYTVTANGTNTLTVNLNGDSLAAVSANTSISLIPYWTLGTAFPASDANISYIPTTGKARATQILMPDMVTAGVDLAPSTFYFYSNGAWRLSGGVATAVYDDTILPPVSYFTVRNTTVGTTFTPNGSVYMNRLAVPLATQTTTPQDNAVAVNRPTSVTLNELGLIASGAFTPTTGKARQDQLITFDNSNTGTDKAPTAIYYYDTAWRLAGGTAGVDYGATSLPYGTGIVVRKATSSNGATVFWQNTRNY